MKLWRIEDTMVICCESKNKTWLRIYKLPSKYNSNYRRKAFIKTGRKIEKSRIRASNININYAQNSYSARKYFSTFPRIFFKNLSFFFLWKVELHRERKEGEEIFHRLIHSSSVLTGQAYAGLNLGARSCL